MSIKKVASKQVSGLRKALVSVMLLSSALSVGSVFAANESIALQNIDKFIASEKVDKGNSNWKLSLNKPPLQQFTQGKQYIWKLKTTEGDIEINLLPKTAPMHVSSTMYLTRLGFYDNIVFHRVIQGFMAQGGDPTGTGRNGPGYTYDGEFSGTVQHNKPGLLSMANAGPGTDGSQFFLTFVPTGWLDGKHTIFGEVTKGMGVVKVLESFGSKSGKTSKNLSILKATIEVR
ncbi:MAG: peptidylprolyl isomerase [Oceanospirillaceae bacterium]